MTARIRERLDRIRAHLEDSLARVLAAILIETQNLPAAKAIELAQKVTRAELEAYLAKAAARQIGNLDLSLSWIARSLLELREIIDGFDLRRLEAFRKQKESTREIWEGPLEQAIKKLTASPSGVYRSVASIFDDNRKYQKHSTDVLFLANEIRSKAKIIERELKRFLNPFWDRVLSWRSVAAMVVLAILVAAVVYVLRAPGEARVEGQLQHDVEAIWTIVQKPESSWFEKLVSVVSLLARLVSAIPGLLLLAAVLLAGARTFVLRERWKVPQLRAVEGKLAELAKSLRGADAASTVATLASALGFFEKMASEIVAAQQASVPSRMQVGKEKGELVARVDGKEVKRVTRADLESLSQDQRDYVETLEKAIQRRYEIWSSVKPGLGSLGDPVQQAQTEARLKEVIGDMNRDVKELLEFLRSLGIEPAGQYAHILHLGKQATP